MKNSLKEFCRISEVMDCENEDGLWKVLSDITDAESVILFDKFFLGYFIGHKINEIKYHHKERRICFFERGDCHPFFCLRVHEFKADSFISNIEKPEHMKVELSKVIAGIPTYPEEVKNYLRVITSLDKRNFGEVTRQEEMVGVRIGDGLSQKQVSIELGTAAQTVNTQFTYLKNKIGYENDANLSLLNRQTFRYAYD